MPHHKVCKSWKKLLKESRVQLRLDLGISQVHNPRSDLETPQVKYEQKKTLWCYCGRLLGQVPPTARPLTFNSSWKPSKKKKTARVGPLPFLSPPSPPFSHCNLQPQVCLSLRQEMADHSQSILMAHRRISHFDSIVSIYIFSNNLSQQSDRSIQRQGSCPPKS